MKWIRFCKNHHPNASDRRFSSHVTGCQHCALQRRNSGSCRGGTLRLPESLCIDLIRQQGISGNFFGEEHTVRQMRKTVWYPTLMDRALSQGPEKDSLRDMLAQASSQYKNIMASAEYEVEAEKRREIDWILSSAKRVLTET